MNVAAWLRFSKTSLLPIIFMDRRDTMDLLSVMESLNRVLTLQAREFDKNS